LDGTAHTEIWYYPNNPGGIASADFGVSPGSLIAFAQMSEWSGVVTASPLDQTGTLTVSTPIKNPTISTSGATSAANELVSPVGEPNAKLFAVGPNTSGWGAGAFARPGTNAAPFRENDALARRILGVLAEDLGADVERGGVARVDAEYGDVETAAASAASGKAHPWNN
jgi:hypothetical protein